MYELIANISVTSRPTNTFVKIWKFHIPLKIMCFSWLCLSNRVHTWDNLIKKVGLDWIGATCADQLLKQLIIYFMIAALPDWLQLTLDPLLAFHFFGRRLTTHITFLLGSAKEIILFIFLFFWLGKYGWQETNVYLKTNCLIFTLLYILSRNNFSSILFCLNRKLKGELLDWLLFFIFLLASLMGLQPIKQEV